MNNFIRQSSRYVWNISHVTRLQNSYYSTTTTVDNYYDIVVVGGGMVGTAMACSLGLNKRLANKRILLLEANKPKRIDQITDIYSNRVSAVSPSSVRFFQKLGIWQSLVNYRVHKVTQLQVLDSCSQSRIHFEQSSLDDQIAYIIENDAIVASLFNRITDGCSNNVTVKIGAHVDQCRVPIDTCELAELRLDDGTEIRTKLLIGADGAQSKVRLAMNVEYTSWDYDQSAIVATLNLSQTSSSNTVAWQRFTPLGPIALLPLSDNISSLVWTTSTIDAQRLLTLSAEEFIDELNTALWTDEQQDSTTNQALFIVDRLINTITSSNIQDYANQQLPPTIVSLQSDTRAAFPLSFGHAECYVKTRTALIGDAAHRLHPLAGQGVNLGWNDAQCLTDIIDNGITIGADPGSLTLLADYDTMRQRVNIPIMIGIDWLNRLYRTKFVPAVFVRSFGLYGVNRCTMLKDFFIKQASGQH